MPETVEDSTGAALTKKGSVISATRIPDHSLMAGRAGTSTVSRAPPGSTTACTRPYGATIRT